jgi:hypothetical protein
MKFPAHFPYTRALLMKANHLGHFLLRCYVLFAEVCSSTLYDLPSYVHREAPFRVAWLLVTESFVRGLLL